MIAINCVENLLQDGVILFNHVDVIAVVVVCACVHVFNNPKGFPAGHLR